MARPIWKGHISFGLVMVPVTLYAAEEPAADLHFHLLDARDHSRVKYERVNEKTGREVEWRQTVRGYEVSHGHYVILTPEDFKKAAPRATKTAEIVDFVDRDQIPPQYFNQPYILEPSPGGEKGYVLLREALARTKKVGVCKLVIHTRQYMAVMFVEDKALMVSTIRYEDELRKPEDFALPNLSASALKITPKELEMAETLIEGMSGKWDPARYKDEYTGALRKYIEARARGVEKPKIVEEEPAETGPYNIMEMLRQSIEGRDAGKPSRRAALPRRAGRVSRPAPRRKAG